MLYVTGTTKFQMEKRTAITLGKFDGLHRGHQTLMKKVLSCKEQGLSATVFTFDLSPLAVMEGKSQTPMLLTNQERREHLEQMGMEALIEFPFTKEISHMSAEAFVRDILVKQLRVGMVVIGTDFHFGHNRSGDAALLEDMAKTYDFRLCVEDKLRDEDSGRIISSSFIREELKKGNMEKVNALLGYSYGLEGTVINGNHLGSRIGFPTANLCPPSQKNLPPNGVYATRTCIQGKWYLSVTNVGNKPTVGDYPIGAETFVYDWKEPLYGEQIQVEFLHQIRAEKKFDSLEELRQQVERDKKTARQFLVEKDF